MWIYSRGFSRTEIWRGLSSPKIDLCHRRGILSKSKREREREREILYRSKREILSLSKRDILCLKWRKIECQFDRSLRRTVIENLSDFIIMDERKKIKLQQAPKSTTIQIESKMPLEKFSNWVWEWMNEGNKKKFYLQSYRYDCSFVMYLLSWTLFDRGILMPWTKMFLVSNEQWAKRRKTG